MLEARGESEDAASPAWSRPARAQRLWRDAGKPVLILLHQPHSIPGHIGRLLAAKGHPLDVRRPRYDDPLPQSLDGHAGVVIFGGPMSANDPDDYIKRETDFVGIALRDRKPLLGICLGAQMLANHLGGTVAFDAEQHAEIGYYPVRATAEGERLCDWPEHVYEWHREGFTVPRGAKLLVERDGRFPNQAFSYADTAIGLQFHPEITYAQVCRWSCNNPARLGLPGARPREEHLEGHFHHAPRVHAWLDEFLARWLRGALIVA